MGKGARNKKQAAAAGGSGKVLGAVVRVRPLQEVEAKVGTLADSITGLLGAVETMSLQLGEISSSVKGVFVSGCGKSTPAEPVLLMDSETDIVSEFRNLKQNTNVAEYREKFEELRDLLLEWLKPDIKLSIGNRKPKTLCHAFNLAHIEEIEMEVMKDKLMSSGGNEQNMPSKYPLVDLGPDHPLKFGALVGENPIKILICTENVHNYDYASLAISTGREIEEGEPILVNFSLLGYREVSRFKCPSFRWTVKGEESVADVRIVEIKAAYQVLLGKDWLHYDFLLRHTPVGMTLETEGEIIGMGLLDKRKAAASSKSNRM
ncbi:OLC1v1000387C1 [Oldenlandia corymbosa var. corymbosa]|uniref:OLC1v1000387C1 n=1 Tax=Oldenlandia corymbosa var. corymbosa TaxID=529605 RepID=A0AAV1D4Y8_OLDCO|nr:OLC1v1000387C1 [Oldenlandia corymbosa var. corymbosa]